MEPSETEDRNEEDANDAHDDDGDDSGDSLELLRLFVMKHVDKAEDEDTSHVERQGDKEHEEVTIVPTSNAIVDPRTVVIEDLDAVVTYGTVRTAGRPVELAGYTPFHTYRDSINLYIPVEWSTEVIISVLVRTRSRNHSWVHEGGHGEIDEYEECDDPLKDWYRVPVFLQDKPFHTRKIEE